MATKRKPIDLIRYAIINGVWADGSPQTDDRFFIWRSNAQGTVKDRGHGRVVKVHITEVQPKPKKKARKR